MTRLEKFMKWVETASAGEVAQFCFFGFESAYCVKEDDNPTCRNKRCHNCLKEWLNQEGECFTEQQKEVFKLWKEQERDQ